MTRTSAAATDLVAGIAAGLAAALVMSLFQSAVTRIRSQGQPSETAATKAADVVSEEVSGAPVKPGHKKRADSLLHYLTGAVAGAIYGLVGGAAPALMAGRGLLYGTLVWAVADEGLVPALGLAPPPDQISLSEHGFALSSHLVFGAALDVFRRQINSIVSAPKLI